MTLHDGTCNICGGLAGASFVTRTDEIEDDRSECVFPPPNDAVDCVLGIGMTCELMPSRPNAPSLGADAGVTVGTVLELPLG